MVILSSAYFAPIQYYAYLYAASSVTEDRGEHFVKQTFRNRCYIATPNGSLALIIPIIRDDAAHTSMRDIRISEHGNWRHLHWSALESAYDSSPYFMYYADDLRPLFEKKFIYLVDFNEALERTLLALLSLECPINVSNDYVAAPPSGALDLRSIISPKASTQADTLFHPVPYYQVFAERTGFLPNLSIVDLLFNLGPESRLVLKKCLSSTTSTP